MRGSKKSCCSNIITIGPPSIPIGKTFSSTKAPTASRLAKANGRTGNGNGVSHTESAVAVAEPPAIEPVLSGSEELMPLRGVSARIAENMAISATIPLATSQRIIPVKVIDENRRLINHHRALLGKSKVSYTHLIGWAIVKSVKANPALNHAFASNAAGELFRVVKNEINFGLAIDVAGKNGARSLLVPNIKNAGAMAFAQYMAAFDDLVVRARNGKLSPAGFPGHQHLADESRHGRNHGVHAAPGLRTGRDHRGRRDGLPRRISRRLAGSRSRRSASAR